MASKVKHNFKESALALLRGDWCNRVARRVSYWMGVNGIDVNIPDTPSGNDPIKVGLNVPNAAQILAGEMLAKNLLGRKSGVPFSLTPVLNTAKTAVASLNVYLPTLTFKYEDKTYTVETGSGTGYVTRLDSNGPWYRINGLTTGDIYLVDTSTSSVNRMRFSATAPSSGTIGIKLGTVTFDSSASAASVAQYEHPMRGGVEFGGGGGAGVTSTTIPYKSSGSTGQIGSNEKAARSDHVHPLCDAVAGAVTAANQAVATANAADTKASNAATAARNAQQTADNANTAVTTLSGTVSTLSSTVSGMSTTVSGLQTTVSSLDTEVSTINTAVQQLIDVTIAQLDSQVTQAQETARDAQSRVATIEADYVTSSDLDDFAELGNTAPLSDQVSASAGSSTYASRIDHRHPIETPAAAGSLTTLGATSGEGSSSEDASTYTTQGGLNGKGLRIRVQTRTYYDHTASTPVLYGFFRMMNFNQFGRLVSVSRETRFEIDTPTVVEV